MIKEHSFPVQRTAHYYTMGEPGPHINKVWIVCHGYGQLGSSIIRKFEAFDDGQTLIIAPEGLSRFYWGGVTGNVAASWMTRQNRLDEIDDYCKMLDQIYAENIPQLSPDVKITLMGFSQGCATQCRWMLASQPHFYRLVLWAGQVPEDLDYQPHMEYLSSKEIIMLYGDQDEFITPKRLEWMKGIINDKGLSVRYIPFVGKHQVVRSVLIEHFKD